VKLGYTQFFAATSRQTAASSTHASIADARLRSLVNEVKMKLQERLEPVMIVAENVEDLEEAKKASRDQERYWQEIQEKVKDLELEVGLARAREEEAKRVVEDLAAKAG
jgi:hypothetical protein